MKTRDTLTVNSVVPGRWLGCLGIEGGVRIGIVLRRILISGAFIDSS